MICPFLSFPYVYLTPLHSDDLKVGRAYKARVVRLMDYGAFVELEGCGGAQALLHISELAAERVRLPCFHFVLFCLSDLIAATLEPPSTLL